MTVPAYDSPAMEPLRRLLWRAPLLVPLAVLCCAVIGGATAWACGVILLTVTAGLGLWRVSLCALLCGLLAGLTLAVQREREAELATVLAQQGAAELQGVVVQKLAYGCVVQLPWPGLRVAVQGDTEWRVADVVRFVAEPLPPLVPPVEGMFSTERWMRGQGISARLALHHGECKGRSYGWWSLVRWAEDVRAAFANRLMPPGTEADPRRQTLCALLLGEKGRAESDTMEVFRRGGCLHVFAVSGLHVGLLAAILGWLLRAAHLRPAIGRWVLLIGVGLYVLITGLAAPALRAYLLLAALLFGLILRRRATLLNTWCFAALLLLLLRPSQLFQAGFQLSFAIYAAICLGARFCMSSPRWFGPDDYLPPTIYTRRERLLSVADMALRGVVAVSLCAWLASLPFSVLHFHVVNTTSYLTNIAITPLLPIVMCCGLLALCFGSLPVLGAACHWLAVQSAGVLMGAVGIISSSPGAFLPAQGAAPPSAAIIVAQSYGSSSFAVLGNPGLLVGDVQREDMARYGIEPAVFHAGFSPAAVSGASEASLRLYARSWPHLRALPELVGGHCSLRTSAGNFTLYCPSVQMARSSALNARPVVIWDQPEGARIIYVGDAPASTLESLPESERRADVLILGYNPAEPVIDTDLLRSFFAGELVLLPSASLLPLDTGLLSGTRVRRLEPGDCYRLSAPATPRRRAPL